MAHARWSSGGRSRRSTEWARRVYLLGGCLALSGFFLFVLLRRDAARIQEPGASLRALPSPALLDATRLVPRAFSDLLVDSIQRDGYLTVTVHVALADSASGAAARFADGSNPKTNLTWDALYGVETHFANAAGWRRAHTDSGDGRTILRRVVFQRTAEPSPGWQELGMVSPFDVYVLVNAWPAEKSREAMDQPVREAMLDAPIVVPVDDREMSFGSRSVLIGYLGRNAMDNGYWDPFAALTPSHARSSIGVFYLCSMSAVYLHDTVVRHGLYPVLFTREPIVPEAYLLDGMLRALLRGEIDDGFIHGAAEQYTKYQKGISPERARRILFR